MSSLFGKKTHTGEDNYMTPLHAWADIEKFIPNQKKIWESAYGDGSSSKYFRDNGYNVIHDDTLNYLDDEPDEWDIQITNPPYSIKKKWFERAKELGKPFIMIAPCFTISTGYMRELFGGEIQIIIPRRRIQFRKINEVEAKGKCNFDTFYYCWKIGLPRDIIYLH